MSSGSRAVSVLDPAQLIGVWERELLVDASGREDVTTRVTWLQGRNTYLDLRRPAERPALETVHGVRDLTIDQVRWMATQEAFAGELAFLGDHFEWIRAIDLQPARTRPDAGTLALVGDLLVEHGWHDAYREHWRPCSGPVEPVWSRRLVDDATGVRGVVVRVGSTFAWARDRRMPLAAGRALADLVDSAASLGEAQDLVDLEISFGTVEPPAWTITASTLPFREGQNFELRFSSVGRAHTREPRARRVAVRAQLDSHPAGRRGDHVSAPSSFTEVPVIDVAGLRSADPDERERVVDQLGAAARDIGFFHVTGTDVSAPLFDNLLAATTEFFALPLAQKMRYYIGNSTCHRGYVPEGEEVFSGGTVDRKEAFDTGLDLPADDPDHLAGNPLLGPNQWPDLPGFAAAVTNFYDAVLGLGRLLLQGFALALGESPQSFNRVVTKAPSQLRLIHYPFDPDALDAVGIGAHTDYECFTLLKPTAPGLEVLNGAGDWIDVPPRPDAFVVNIGDMLETWTNGEFVATTHRVRKVREERYSFPLFFCADYHTRIAPLPQYIRPGEIPRRALVAGEHLFAQTAQSFTYLKKRIAAGEITLPDDAVALSSFGQEARQRATP